MGVDGGFFAQVHPANVVRLRDLSKARAYATAALDASIWIHQVARSADAHAWLSGNIQPALDAFLVRIFKLRRLNVGVLVVFDGQPHAAKRNEEDARRKKREKDQAKLAELQAKRAAGESFTDAHMLKIAKRCVAQRPGFEARLKSALDEALVPHETAPFEADSQLAFLARTGRVEYVITEDADLVVLGTPRVLRLRRGRALRSPFRGSEFGSSSGTLYLTFAGTCDKTCSKFALSRANVVFADGLAVAQSRKCAGTTRVDEYCKQRLAWQRRWRSGGLGFARLRTKKGRVL